MFTFDAGALSVTILTLHKLGISERQAAVAATNAAGKVLEAKIRQNISLTTYTLADLARMDHPYARRHGSIRIHRKGSTALLRPENRVHTQGGSLLSSLQSSKGSGQPSFRVWLDRGIAPHAVYVVGGTRVMLPRDVLWDTARAPAVQKKMMLAITKKLGKMLRTGAALRFKSAPRPQSPGGAVEA